MQVLRLWFPQLCNFTLTSATSPTLCSTLAVVFNSSLSSLYSLLLVKQVLITLVELRADLYTWKLLRNTFQGASDRNLITIGLVTMVVALIWLMCTLPSFSHHTPANLPFFVVGVAIDLAGKEGRLFLLLHKKTTLDEIAGIPTVCDVALALYSKLLPDRVQGAGQVTRNFQFTSEVI